MEKTRKERQTLWDFYANKAICEAKMPVACAHDYAFYLTQSDIKRHPSRVKLFKELLNPCGDKDCNYHQMFADASKVYQSFYDGYAKECLVLWQDSVWACVRIGDDLMYKSVNPWDMATIKAHARENDLFYDMRTVEIAYAKQVYSEYDNVLIASF